MKWVKLLMILSLVLAVHELGHFFAMRRLGVEVEAFGIGLPIQSLPHWELDLTQRYQFKLNLHPVLIGAYVKPAKDSQAKLANLPYADFALIAGAGIRANLLLFGVIAACFELLRRYYFRGSMFLAMTLFLWLANGIFCRYVLPCLSLASIILVLGVIVWMLLGKLPGIGKSILAQARLMATLSGIFSILAGLSAAIGITNAFPFRPCDGGLLLEKILAPRWPGFAEFNQHYGLLITLWVLTIIPILVSLVRKWWPTRLHS